MSKGGCNTQGESYLPVHIFPCSILHVFNIPQARGCSRNSLPTGKWKQTGFLSSLIAPSERARTRCSDFSLVGFNVQIFGKLHLTFNIEFSVICVLYPWVWGKRNVAMTLNQYICWCFVICDTETHKKKSNIFYINTIYKIPKCFYIKLTCGSY